MSAIPSTNVHVAALRRVLEELAELGDHMVRAVERDNLEMMIACQQAARNARARLGRHQREIEGNLMTPEIIVELRNWTERAKLAEQVTELWRQRSIPDDMELLRREGGEYVVADRMLPTVWNSERDLVLLVAPPDALVEALRGLGQKRLLTVTNVCSESLVEVARFIRQMHAEPPERVVIRAFDISIGSELHVVSQCVDDALVDIRVHRATVGSFSATWVTQGLVNLPKLAKCMPVGALDDRLAGIPMIIVAPGPSLDSNIAYLKELEGRAIILGFSHTATALSRAGIRPDILLTVDPQDVGYHFDQTDLQHITLINAATAHPSLFQKNSAATMMVAANGDTDDWLFQLLGVPSDGAGGGSVATTAFALALRWKCDPIVFVGLDLSYRDGQMYVSTSCDGQARAEFSKDSQTVSVRGWSEEFDAMKSRGGPANNTERVVQLPGWHGGTVQSSLMFALFHKWFEATAQKCDSSVRIFNCTEGGAFIRGMEHRRLVDVAASMNWRGSFLEELTNARDPHSREKESDISERLQRMIEDLAAAEVEARDCTAILKKENHNPKNLVRKEARLRDHLRKVPVASLFAHDLIYKTIQQAGDVDSEAWARTASLSLYEAVIEAAQWLLPQLRYAKRQITDCGA